ncbi:MAG: hypothetical protein JWP01_2227 [Myxococcales bacterium]|nr:hypothetical protein [Myxococcales bacterium]
MHCCSPMLNKTSECFALLVAGALLFGTTACGDNEVGDDLDGDIDEGADEIAEGRARGELLADMASEDLAAQNEMVSMSIAGHIMITLDQGEIMQAQLALDDVVFDPAVQEYADQMIEEHTPHAQRVEDLLASFGLTPLDNRISAALRAESEAALVDLANSDDPDKDYMAMQVTMHEEAFVLVGSLADDVETAELDALIRDTQAAIAEHRDDALDLLQLH